MMDPRSDTLKQTCELMLLMFELSNPRNKHTSSTARRIQFMRQCIKQNINIVMLPNRGMWFSFASPPPAPLSPRPCKNYCQNQTCNFLVHRKLNNEFARHAYHLAATCAPISTFTALLQELLRHQLQTLVHRSPLAHQVGALLHFM
jgi:hypothetical protein